MAPVSQPLEKASPLSAGLCNASILLYTLWLLVPAAQTTGRAATGAACVGLFALGALLDQPYRKARLLDFLLRAVCAGLLPLALWFFLHRGGGHFAGYYAQQAMFWFPLLYCAYARQRGDPRLWRYVKPVLLAALVLTTLTTIGWLIEGMSRPGRIYAYSRSLGSGEPDRAVYLKELMLRNIGGYDFVYASMLALPLTCYGAIAHRGWKRAGFALFCAAQFLMIALSQYTYAMVMATAILGMELLAAVLRWLAARAFRRNLSALCSLLCTVPVLLGVYLLRMPLVSWAISVCRQLALVNFESSLTLLQHALAGNVGDTASRLEYYRTALNGFFASPFIGGLPGTNAPLSQHSDLLDLLSAGGLLGAAAFFFLVYFLGRGALRGVARHSAAPHFLLQYTALLVLAALGTVTYSRDISLVLCLGALLVLERGDGRTVERGDGRGCRP